MLTTDDEKKIKKIVDNTINGSAYEKKMRLIVNEAVEDSTESMRASLVNIEKDREILKDIWEFIKDHTRQIKDHEERILTLESSPKAS